MVRNRLGLASYFAFRILKSASDSPGLSGFVRDNFFDAIFLRARSSINSFKVWLRHSSLVTFQLSGVGTPLGTAWDGSWDGLNLQNLL